MPLAYFYLVLAERSFRLRERKKKINVSNTVGPTAPKSVLYHLNPQMSCPDTMRSWQVWTYSMLIVQLLQ